MDPAARLDSSTPSQTLGDIIFGGDRFRCWLALLDPHEREPARTRPAAISLRATPWDHSNPIARKSEY
jgi:hypothetical protein